MRCCKIVRSVAEEHAQPILKEIANIVPDPLLIKTVIVTLKRSWKCDGRVYIKEGRVVCSFASDC